MLFILEWFQNVVIVWDEEKICVTTLQCHRNKKWVVLGIKSISRFQKESRWKESKKVKKTKGISFFRFVAIVKTIEYRTLHKEIKCKSSDTDILYVNGMSCCKNKKKSLHTIELHQSALTRRDFHFLFALFSTFNFSFFPRLCTAQEEGNEKDFSTLYAIIFIIWFSRHEKIMYMNVLEIFNMHLARSVFRKLLEGNRGERGSDDPSGCTFLFPCPSKYTPDPPLDATSSMCIKTNVWGNEN